VILDLTSEDDSGEWEEGAEDSLSAIAGIRSELAAGDLRGLYLAWLSAYGAWERDEGAFGDDGEEVREPPVPAGLGSLTAPQRALADFLRVDPDLLEAVEQGSPVLPEVNEDPGEMAAHIAGLPGAEKDRLLMLVARDQAARARMELLRGVRETQIGSEAPGAVGPWPSCWTPPRNSARRAVGGPKLRPPPAKSYGSINAKPPGSGAWMNLPGTRKPPGRRPGG